MAKPFKDPGLEAKQRIDIRIFVGEIDRLRGESTVPKRDPRSFMSDQLSLEDRINFLREVYAGDMQAKSPQYHWKNERFERIKFERSMELQSNIMRTQPVGGPCEQLIELLDLPYPRVMAHNR